MNETTTTVVFQSLIFLFLKKNVPMRNLLVIIFFKRRKYANEKFINHKPAANATLKVAARHNKVIYDYT